MNEPVMKAYTFTTRRRADGKAGPNVTAAGVRLIDALTLARWWVETPNAEGEASAIEIDNLLPRRKSAADREAERRRRAWGSIHRLRAKHVRGSA